jgi:glycosyltransferase involved in cell wall biosynthesis
MLFDLEFTGHHANYIRHFVNFWKIQQSEKHLTIVVSPEFIQRHTAIFDLALSEKGQSHMSFQSISPQEAESLQASTRIHRALRRLKEWKLLCKYAKLVGADHCLVMFIDKLQLPIILGFQPPCPISGIYFQPSFHYKDFHENASKHKTGFYSDSYIKDLRDFLFLHRSAQNSKLKQLFVLDPFVVDFIQNKYKKLKCTYLPDPIEPYKPKESFFQVSSHSIEEDRIAFLIFGFLDERKGITKFLEAIDTLPVETCKKICLILAGQLESSMVSYLPQRLEYLAKTKEVQFICDFEYISEEKIYSYFQMADIILAIYQNHLGMSGILLTAAAMQKPVLCQSYGLMGQLVRERNLGLDVDSTQVSEIVARIEHILSTPIDNIGNRDSMIDWVESHAPSNFYKTIIDNI